MRWTPGGRGNIDDLRGRSGGSWRRAHGDRRCPRPARPELVYRDRLPVAVSNAAPVLYRDIRHRRRRGAPRRKKRRWSTSSTPSWKTRSRRGRQLLGGQYQRTRAVLFRDAVQSTCGYAQSAVGPFYCPGGPPRLP